MKFLLFVISGILLLDTSVPANELPPSEKIRVSENTHTPNCEGLLTTRRRFLKRTLQIGGVTVIGGTIADHVAREPVSITGPFYDPNNLGQGAVHLAVIGDSLSQDFSSRSDIHMLKKSRYQRTSGCWVSDSTYGNSPTSLFERIQNHTGTKVSNFSRPGAQIIPSSGLSWGEKPIRTLTDMSDQVDQLVEQDDFPNLILLWIGHNDVDWVTEKESLSEETRAMTDNEFLRNYAEKRAHAYLKQVDRIQKTAKTQNYPVSIIVLGLGDTRSILDLRNSLNPKKYHGFHNIVARFPSLGEDYAEETIEMRNQINELLKEKIQTRRTAANVNLIYFDVFARYRFKTESTLHQDDAFHLSSEGHSEFASMIFDELTLKGVFKRLRAPVQ